MVWIKGRNSQCNPIPELERKPFSFFSIHPTNTDSGINLFYEIPPVHSLEHDLGKVPPTPTPKCHKLHKDNQTALNLLTLTIKENEMF